MKKYLAFFLLLSVTALVYGRPQKLVIKTDKESVELRYWPLDGKQLPFYSLYSPVIVTCRQMTEIELPCNETIYKISLGKGKTSLVYATAGAVDTVSLYRDSVYFSGHNQTYNLYLEEAEKADEYCRSYSYTRNHPLAKVQSLAIFKTIVADRKAKDEALLNKEIPVGRFMLQQQRFIDLRYKALFLKNFSDLVLSMNSPNRIRAALPLRPLRFAAKPLSPDDCIRRPAADTNRPHRHGRTTPSQQLSSRKDRIRLRSTSGTTPRHLSLQPVAGH